MSGKIKHALLIWIFILGTGASLLAQAPGYMGKKLTLGYGFYFHPSFTNAVLDYGDSPFNVQHEIFAEAVTGKKFSIGLSAHFYRFIYNNREAVAIRSYTDRYGNSYNQYEDHPSGQYKIRAQNFVFYGKAFKRNYVAPWGKYFQFGFIYTRYITEYYPGDMQVKMQRSGSPGYIAYYSDFGPPLKSYQTVDLMIGNGRSRIFANKIVFEYGYTLQVVSFLKSFAYTVFEPYDGFDADKYIETTAGKRVAAINRFNFYVKLGYLF